MMDEYDGIRKEDLEKYIGMGLTEKAICERLNIDAGRLHAAESMMEVYLKSFPKRFRNIPYESIVSMRRDKLMTSKEISKATGWDFKDVSGALHYYRFSWDTPELKKRFMSRVLAEHNQEFKDKHGGKMPFQVDSIRAKAEKTHIKKYGGKSPFNSPDVREKSKQTTKEHYGVENCMSNREVFRKARKTMIERYGGPYTLSSEQLKKKAFDTKMKRYGTISPSGVKGSSLRRKYHKVMQSRYGVDWPMQYPDFMDKMEASMSRAGREGSSLEMAMKKWLEDDFGLVEGDDFILHDHHSIGRELDFLFPKTNTAVEISPSWCHHCCVSKRMLTPKNPDYHIRKWRLAKEHGIELITLFDWMLNDSITALKTAPFLATKALGKPKVTIHGEDMRISADIRQNELKEFSSVCRLHGFAPRAWRRYAVEDGNGQIIGSFGLTRSKQGKVVRISDICWLPGLLPVDYMNPIADFIAAAFPDCESIMAESCNDFGWGDDFPKAGFTELGEPETKLWFVNHLLRNEVDMYPPSVATAKSARSGVIAKRMHPMDVSDSQARDIVECELPHRADHGSGYMALRDSGWRRWLRGV